MNRAKSWGLLLVLALLVMVLAAFPAAAQPESPDVVITEPAAMSTISGIVTVSGTVNPPNLSFYYLEVASFLADPASAVWTPVTLPANVPVTNGPIAQWNTAMTPDDTYALRLHAFMTDGTEAAFLQRPVRVANAGAPVGAATPQPQPTPAGVRPIDETRFEAGVQVQVSHDLMEQWADVAANQLGVNWVKMQVRWENFEPENDVYDWTDTDLFIPAMAEQGVNVLVSVVTAPDWAREPGVNVQRHGPPADPAEYAEFVGELVARYPGQIGAVEVWNEQNLDREWTSIQGLSASNYVSLLAAAHDAIKAVDPGIIVVSGALSPTGLNNGVQAWDDFTYMDQMIAAGLLTYADCVGAHHNGLNLSPDYEWNQVPNDPTARFRGPFDNPHHSWSFRSTLQGYAQRIRNAGGDQQLCVTEFGWPSATGLSGVANGLEFSYDNTLEEQRDFTVKALDFMSQSGDVRLAFLWNLNYGPQAGWAADNENVPWSIIGPDFVFRPVCDAVRDWNRAYEGEA